MGMGGARQEAFGQGPVSECNRDFSIVESLMLVCKGRTPFTSSTYLRFRE